MLLVIDGHHLHFDLVAQLQVLFRMGDPAPRDVVNVEEPVDAPEIDEGPVVGNALHEAVDHLAFLHVLPELFPFPLLLFLHQHAPGDDDVCLLLVDLDDLIFQMASYEGGRVLHRLDIDLGYGQKGAHPYVHHEAALHLGDHGAFHGRPVFEGFVDVLPELDAVDPLLREREKAVLDFPAHDHDLDLVADLALSARPICRGIRSRATLPSDLSPTSTITLSPLMSITWPVRIFPS